MTYKILADFTLLIHLLWILFLVFGALPGIRSKAIKVFHLLGLFFALIIHTLGWYCPLTYLEVWLRAKHDPNLAYAGSFIVHYVEKMVYLQLSRNLILILTIFWVGFNVWVYLRRTKGVFRHRINP
jgi:TRAP-type uncharacterized transport system fused permease subunit